MDTGLDALKTASKQVVHKACGFLGNKFADAVTKSSDNKIVKQDGTLSTLSKYVTKN